MSAIVGDTARHDQTQGLCYPGVTPFRSDWSHHHLSACPYGEYGSLRWRVHSPLFRSKRPVQADGAVEIPDGGLQPPATMKPFASSLVHFVLGLSSGP